MVIRRFLEATSSQLTYSGLFHLSETLPAGSLCALFRNSHFSVLYRRPEETDRFPTGILPRATLFQLVTDQSFLHEPTVIWESLEDVDGAVSRFYDSRLQPARIREDWTRRDARSSTDQTERDNMHDAEYAYSSFLSSFQTKLETFLHSMALAAQLQHDEYEQDQNYEHRRRLNIAHRQAPPASSYATAGKRPEELQPAMLADPDGKKEGKDKSKKKEKNGCVIC